MLNVVELFSGIGSQKFALAKSELQAKVINTSDWFIPAIIAYDKLFSNGQISPKISKLSKDDLINLILPYKLSLNGKDELSEQALKRIDINILKHLYQAISRTNNLGNIVGLDSDSFNEKVDLMTYSFPCQDLSNVGAFHGYKDGIDEDKKTRSGLLWEVKRILEDINQNNKTLPRYLLLENVTSLNSIRHKDNFKKWRDYLENLGYANNFYTLNAIDFGIPQNRNRIFMISVLVKGISKSKREKIHQLLEKDIKSNQTLKLNLKNYLRLDYSNPVYYHEALESQPNLTPSRKMIYRNNYPIYRNGNFIRHTATITTKQDRHPNSGTLDFNTDRGNFRYLTPREAFMLMGFEEEQFNKLISNNFRLKNYSQRYFFSRDTYYRLFGNSIVVDVLVHVFNRIADIEREF